MAKIALITGGSSGLGFAYAEILGQQGYNIIILARNLARINSALQQLHNKGITADGFSCDITDEHQLAETFSKVKRLTPHLDFLILNAGEVTPRLLSDFTSASDLKKVIEIDLWGTIQSAWFFLPLLHEGSKILMTSSGFGLMGAAGYSTYCAAKAGIINFGESLRREMLANNINVYVACPGDVDTPQLAGELAGQPAWMKEQSSPRKILPPGTVAERILKRCKGKSRMLILPDKDVRLLNLVSGVLPERLKNSLIDGAFPRPRRK